MTLFFFSFWLLKVDNYNRTSKKEKYRLKLCDGEIIIHCGCRLNGPNSSTKKKIINTWIKLEIWTIEHIFVKLDTTGPHFGLVKKNALSSWEQNGDQTSANGGLGSEQNPGPNLPKSFGRSAHPSGQKLQPTQFGAEICRSWKFKPLSTFVIQT